MKKSLVLLPLLFLFASAPCLADLYRWTDREGVIHMTDDPDKVPPEYRGKVEVYKSEPVRKPVEAPVEVPAGEAGKLYGDQPLEWWVENFRRLDQEISSLEGGMAAKKQYIDVFEGGRRFGQVFGPTEIETYNRYRRELAQDESKLTELKAEREELRRKATIHGVPREVRGE